MHILLVDDEPIVLRAMSRAISLDVPNWRVDTALDGVDALGKLAQENYDCIVSDVQMPVMDGVELLTNVRSRHPEMIRIILSGQADSKVALRAIKPMHRYLAKPCQAHDLVHAIDRTVTLYRKCQNPDLMRAIGGVDNLPTLPELYQKVVAAIQDPGSTSAKVASAILTDPAVSVKVLQIANSALFAIPRKVNSIEQAITILGCSIVQNLVLTTKILGDHARQIPGFSGQELFDHSLRVAEIARHISRAEKFDRERAEFVFTAALLHDVGTLIMADRLPEQLSQVLRDSQQQGRPRSEVEQDVLRCNHADIGSCLLQLWGLPDEIVQAVAFHHHPHLLNPQNLAHPDNIIFVANVLAHERNPESYRDVWTSAFGTSVADNMCQRFAQWKSALPPRSEA